LKTASNLRLTAVTIEEWIMDVNKTCYRAAKKIIGLLIPQVSGGMLGKDCV
jgi:hypothetical protein